MDTKFWGPSGWKLLHLIAAQDKKVPPAFWSSLPYVLPCKFCRISLTTYYEKLAIPDSPSYQKWLWQIHNEVNEKLRNQGQTIPEDPPFALVNDLYSKILNQPCSEVEFPGWEFLFSIADNHPDFAPSKPMPDYDPQNPPKTLAEKNKLNVLTSVERKRKLLQFWNSLPNALPFDTWRKLWKKHAGPVHEAIKSRKSALQWLWKIRCGMESELNTISKTSFHGICKVLRTKRSGCATSLKAKTCRALKRSANKTMKKRNYN